MSEQDGKQASTLQPPTTLQWHLEEGSWKQAHPGSQKKTTATVDELVEPGPPAPTRRWSVGGWEPDARCSCGCGCGDGRARRLS